MTAMARPDGQVATPATEVDPNRYRRLPARHRNRRPSGSGGDLEPQLVAKRQRRLSDVDEVVLSLYARGLTTAYIAGG